MTWKFQFTYRRVEFSNQFSSKNHQKSLIFIEKTWKIIDFHEKLWKIIADVEISFYIPACRIFLINFHRKIIKIMNFHQKMMVNPGWKSRIGYLNLNVALKKSMKYDRKNMKTKRAFFIRSRNIFGPKIILFFRFWSSTISRSLNIFDEKISSKWCIFFPESWAGLAGLAGLGWAKHSLEL